jgi:hypothetical protein
MAGPDVRSLLVGPDGLKPRQHGLAVAAVFLVGLGLLAVESGRSAPGELAGWWFVGLVALGLAAVAASLDGGLAYAWAVAVAVTLARSFAPIVRPTMALDAPVVITVGVAILVGIAVGTVGFAIGVGGRRMWEVARSAEAVSP